MVLTVLAIFSSLSFNRPFQNLLFDQDLQAILFLGGLFLFAVSGILYGLKKQTNRKEFFLWSIILAILVMLFFRLGAPERSHMIEYGVLTILLHRAVNSQFESNIHTWMRQLMVWLSASFIGAVDEWIQVFLPHRTFDWEDIFFNSSFSLMTVAGISLLQWARIKWSSRVD